MEEQNNLAQKNNKLKDVFGAGTTGWGYATLIAFVINEMPSSSPYKHYLNLLTPLMTITISSLWFIWKIQYFDPWIIDIQIKRKENYLSKARNRLEIAVNDPNSTEEYKMQVHKIVEDIEKALLEEINKAGKY